MENDTDSENEKIKKLKKLKWVVDAFTSVREDAIYNKETKAEFNYIDPTPDFVEGIFYINKTPCRPRYCKRESDTKIYKPKVVIFDRRSLYLFHTDTCCRQWMVTITQGNIFDGFIVLSIFLNSIVLAVTDYSDRDNELEYN